MRMLATFVLLSILVPFGAARAQPEAAKAKARTYVDVIEGNNDFSFALYKRLREDQRPNAIVSPFSVSTILLMTYAGARGKTAEEMTSVLNIPRGTEPAELCAGCGGLIDELTKRSPDRKYRLDIANRLWFGQGVSLLDSFTGTLKTHYGAEAGRVDFAASPENARSEINQWVATHTENQIKDLLAAGTVGPETRLVLANALFFKGTWDLPFPKESTSPAPFAISLKENVQVPMMRQEGRFRYAVHDQLQILELTYSDKALAMIIILPKQVDGLRQIEEVLSSERLEGLERSMSDRKVQVYLPRFRISSNYRLAGPLKEMGLT
ncbi:MAG: serpin family protein, partial [Isosphaeraceae bacterium]